MIWGGYGAMRKSRSTTEPWLRQLASPPTATGPCTTMPPNEIDLLLPLSVAPLGALRPLSLTIGKAFP